MQQGMITLIRIATAVFTAMVILDYFSHFPGKKARRFLNRIPDIGAGAVIALLLYAVKLGSDSRLLVNLALLFLGAAALHLLYRGRPVKFLYALVPAGVSLAADLFVKLLEQYAQSVPAGDEETAGAYAAGLLAARLLFFAVIKIIASFSGQGLPFSAGRYWYGLIAIPFGSVILLLRPVAQVLKSGEALSYYVIAGLVLLYINIAVFSMFEELTRQMVNEQQLELSRRTLKLEQRHFKELEKNRQAIRAIWHDMNNHICAMRRLAAEREYEELHEYLDGLQSEVQEILHFVDTGNPALDAALNEKQLRARQAGVALELSAAIPPGLDLDPLSIVSILSNALDNAIESCLKLEPAHRVVTILLTYKSGFLGISVKNPTDGQLFESPTGDYQTDKEDKEWHGIGLRNIRNAVDRLEGQLRVTHVNDVFSVDAVVPVQLEQPEQDPSLSGTPEPQPPSGTEVAALSESVR